MGKLLPVILLLAVIIYALIDCVRTPEDSMPAGIPKALWVVLILVFPGLGALAWLVISRIARAEAAQQSGTRPGPWTAPPARRRGPVAPDDDPEFLARLEAERRRTARERRRAVKEGRTGNGGKGHPDQNGQGATSGGLRESPKGRLGPERAQRASDHGPADPRKDDERVADEGEQGTVDPDARTGTSE
ncbi:PLD nuclease N-terminal domain-containing protein [Georgenia sp. SYP-B2076]|uniref:PLD nuclease N-terminal domain-containing protein n=1 Tax=Georgenia sp. SYP-B2076 TaxID=2495881 RepID=UPI000F8EDE50|nr:PLD nuclease N-terminal domain-containing protein [Georgenia sp. SYP-B2076]